MAKPSAKEAIFILLRYLTILILSIRGLFIIYYILRPATLYAVSGFLSAFGEVIIINFKEFIFSNLSVELIDACIAGSAFYLLLMLNLSTPMKAGRRAKSLAFSIIGLFILNALRIVLFVMLADKSPSAFDSLHLFFWYFLSIIMVVGIWLATIKIFNIKDIPIYSDLKLLSGRAKGKII